MVHPKVNLKISFLLEIERFIQFLGHKFISFLLFFVFVFNFQTLFAKPLFLRDQNVKRMILVEPGFEVLIYAYDDDRHLRGRWHSGVVTKVEIFENDAGGYLHLPTVGIAFCNIDPEVSKITSHYPIDRTTPLTEMNFDSLSLGIRSYRSMENYDLIRHFLINGITIEESQLPRVGYLLNLIKAKKGFNVSDFLWTTMFTSFFVLKDGQKIQLYDYWSSYRTDVKLEIPADQANPPLASCRQRLKDI